MKMKRPDYVVKRRSMPGTRLPTNAKAPSHNTKLVSYELERRSGREVRPPEKKRRHWHEKILLLDVKRVSHDVKGAESCVEGTSQRTMLPSDDESLLSENTNTMSAWRGKTPESESPMPPEEDPVPRGRKRWPPGEKSPSQEFNEK